MGAAISAIHQLLFSKIYGKYMWHLYIASMLQRLFQYNWGTDYLIESIIRFKKHLDRQNF